MAIFLQACFPKMKFCFRASCHKIAPYSLPSFVFAYDAKLCALRSLAGR